MFAVVACVIHACVHRMEGGGLIIKCKNIIPPARRPRDKILIAVNYKFESRLVHVHV